ncbi:MAG: acetylglutamate kinase [Firmicutes bacterium]|nr:acetylglutamate kinase [Bacillota bacterium]
MALTPELHRAPRPQLAQLVRKAEVLVEALPYLRRFQGSTVVIKYGGHAMLSEELRRSVAQDVVLLKFVGLNPIVVHGGGPEITALMRRVGKEARFVRGLRQTDAETMELAQMVLVGKINKDVVSLLNQAGGQAVGLSGIDGCLLRARRRQPPELGFVGDVTGVRTDLLRSLCQSGFIPVVAPVGVGEAGESYNINADAAAGAVAAALPAQKLIVLTDVEGIYAQPGDPQSLLATLTPRQATELLASGAVEGGMVPKIEACLTAVAGGVPRAHIVDGRMMHALLLEIFTDQGIGTMIAADAEPQAGGVPDQVHRAAAGGLAGAGGASAWTPAAEVRRG